MASPADIPPRRSNGQSPIRHVEPPLELDPEAIEPVAHQVVEHGHEVPAPTISQPHGVIRISNVHRDVEEVVLELMDKVEKLDAEIGRLKRRMTEHSHGANKSRAKDDVNERIIALLQQVSPLKLPTVGVAVNLGLDTTLVGNRLRNLEGKDGVRGEKQSETSKVWWYDPEAS